MIPRPTPRRPSVSSFTHPPTPHTTPRHATPGTFLRCMLSGPCRATMACAGHCVHGPVRHDRKENGLEEGRVGESDNPQTPHHTTTTTDHEPDVLRALHLWERPARLQRLLRLRHARQARCVGVWVGTPCARMQRHTCSNNSHALPALTHTHTNQTKPNQQPRPGRPRRGVAAGAGAVPGRGRRRCEGLRPREVGR